MNERVLHEWVAHERQQRIIEIDGDRLHQKKIPDGEWRSPVGNTFDWVDELARLAAENAKLRACVEKADAEIAAWREWCARIAGDERVCGWVHREDYGLYCLLADPPCSDIPYDAARAEVDK